MPPRYAYRGGIRFRKTRRNRLRRRKNTPTGTPRKRKRRKRRKRTRHTEASVRKCPAQKNRRGRRFRTTTHEAQNRAIRIQEASEDYKYSDVFPFYEIPSGLAPDLPRPSVPAPETPYRTCDSAAPQCIRFSANSPCSETTARSSVKTIGHDTLSGIGRPSYFHRFRKVPRRRTKLREAIYRHIRNRLFFRFRALADNSESFPASSRIPVRKLRRKPPVSILSLALRRCTGNEHLCRDDTGTTPK